MSKPRSISLGQPGMNPRPLAALLVASLAAAAWSASFSPAASAITRAWWPTHMPEQGPPILPAGHATCLWPLHKRLPSPSDTSLTAASPRT